MDRGGPRPFTAGRPTTGRLRLAALGLGLLLAACGAPARSADPPEISGDGIVTAIIDGDTLDVQVDSVRERVRLIGVDTPESVAPERPVQCYGTEASARLAELLPVGTAVRLERDEVARDRFGRLLAYVWRIDDEVLVNLALVEGGFADAVSFGDNEALHDVLVAAEARARSDGTGLWSACGGPDVDIGPPPGR